MTKTPRGRPPTYPFRSMQIGEAFDVPLTPANLNSMRTYAQRYRRLYDLRFSVRTFPDENVIEVSRIGEPPRRKTMREYQQEVRELSAKRR